MNLKSCLQKQEVAEVYDLKRLHGLTFLHEQVVPLHARTAPRDLQLHKTDLLKDPFAGQPTRILWHLQTPLSHLWNLEQVQDSFLYVFEKEQVGSFFQVSTDTFGAFTDLYAETAHLHFEPKHFLLVPSPQRQTDFLLNGVDLAQLSNV
jgi:hypothetical protein